MGQGAGELEGVEKKAIDSGASECVVMDLRRQFVEEFVFPTVIAGCVYEGRYLLGTSIARPILARAQVEAARAAGADALAHGCTGKGNDQVRFESAYAALAPDLEVIAPWRIWGPKSREDLLAYLEERKIPCAASREKIYSRDRNLWHISHEGGALEDPWNPPPDDCWLLTADPRNAPNTPAEVTISFEAGYPRRLDGEALVPEAMVERLNTIAGAHGVGRVDLVENRLVGMKSRGCYETPGGTVIIEALDALRGLCLTRRARHFQEQLALTFAELVYDGQWFTHLRESLWACAQRLAEPLTGDVVVRLHKGSAVAVRRRSPNSLYSESFATFGRDAVYNQSHAEGFIRLLSLPERIAALKRMGAREGL